MLSPSEANNGRLCFAISGYPYFTDHFRAIANLVPIPEDATASDNTHTPSASSVGLVQRSALAWMVVWAEASAEMMEQPWLTLHFTSVTPPLFSRRPQRL
ncbi:hypothetical protein FSOLCH5_013311 [Fusarium solani]